MSSINLYLATGMVGGCKTHTYTLYMAACRETETQESPSLYSNVSLLHTGYTVCSTLSPKKHVYELLIFKEMSFKERKI